MRDRLQNYAIYFGAVGLALWVAAAILFFLSQPTERLIALLVIGLIAIAIYIYLRPEQLRQLVSSRGVRYGSNAVILSIAFIGIIGVLNFLGARYHWHQDVTANQSFTLSPLTVKVLQGLKQPVQATAFFTSRSNRTDVQDRLKEYANVTPNFTYRFVDPEAEPQIANDYKVQYDATVVMERGTRREIATATDEQSLTNAILKVSQDTQPTIYFTTGHGEHSPTDSGNNGMDLLSGALESENYKISTIDLRTITGTLPSDISSLVIAGPQQPFDPAEAKIVGDYLANGGHVLVAVDPQVQSGLDTVLKDWNVQFRNDVVYDPASGFFGQAQTPAIINYPSHAITSDLAGVGSFFPRTRSLTTDAGAQSSRLPQPLLTTSPQSWGETDFASVTSQTAKYDEGADAKGPLTLAYAVEDSGDKKGRLVVIGNSTFVTNGTLTQRVTVGGQQAQVRSGNAQFFFNSLKWLGGQEDLIQIPAKPADSHPIFLTTAQQAFVGLSSVVLLPGAILIIGLLVWLRRR